ncbi:hypothetical protein CASFOL_002625 [Castilleja foliolosa]|uniref:RNase H type-1 domain-containing protein n=1 Tax=Castilleja foliolosa TaxID=1961234 RepID=A0ABD3EIA9_9LAMI
MKIKLMRPKQANNHWKIMLQSVLTRGPPNPCWKAPPVFFFKCNVDAVFKDGIATSGIVIKNHNGSIMLAASSQHSCLDAISAESLAILEACKVLKAHNLDKVIIESDSLNVISSIIGLDLECNWSARPVLDQIKKVWTGWPHWSFVFVHRSANGASHTLANWCFGCNLSGLIPLNSLPLAVFCDLDFPLVEPL